MPAHKNIPALKEHGLTKTGVLFSESAAVLRFQKNIGFYSIHDPNCYDYSDNQNFMRRKTLYFCDGDNIMLLRNKGFSKFYSESDLKIGRTDVF